MQITISNESTAHETLSEIKHVREKCFWRNPKQTNEVWKSLIILVTILRVHVH